MLDIVLPKNNESEFLRIAEQISYKWLIFAYGLDSFNPSKIKAFSSHKANLNIAIAIIITDPSQTKKASKLADLVIAIPSKQNLRVFIEKVQCDLIINLETLEQKDPLHFRASGLNQVLAKILAKKEKFLCINRSTLNTKQKSILFGRIAQNIMLCKKYRVPVIMASFAASPLEMLYFHDVISFFNLFQLNPKETKQNYKALIEKIKFNRKRKSPTFIAKGIEIVE